MNFRDMNGRFSTRNSHSQKFNGSYPFRDMNSTAPEKTKAENIPVPEQIPVNNTSNIYPQNQSIYPTNFPQNRNMQFPNSQNVYQNSIPPVQEKPQNKFMYNKPIVTNNNIPAPPPLPKPDPPQPPKPEIPVPTPPPRMVKPAPVRKKTDDFSMDYGAFAGTFDDNPDQSTPIADIPVMNIDDYKL